MREIRKAITNIINKESTNDNIYILLSAGIDSQSVLFSCLELNKKVFIVSFTREDHESRDFKCAREISKQLSLDFIPVYIPIDLTNITDKILLLSNKFECKLKTDYECMYPMLFAYNEIEKHAKLNNIKEINVTSGLGADIYYLLSKKAAVHYKNKEDEYRDLLYFNPNYSQRSKHEKYCDERGINHIMPYFTDEVYNIFKGTTKKEINTPKEKNDVRDQYKNEIIDNLLFKHTSFHKGDSFISDIFTILLDSEWNIKEFKSVTGIYNAVSKNIINEPIISNSKNDIRNNIFGTFIIQKQ